jgi:hypothetical protein
MQTIANQNHPTALTGLFCIVPMVVIVAIAFVMMAMAQ